MTTLLRLLVVLTCYAWSGFGIFGVLFLIRSNAPSALLLVYAWVAHLALCGLWVFQKPINWPLAITGTLAGCACCIIAPAGLLFVFPCVLLAAYIMLFHKMQSTPRQG